MSFVTGLNFFPKIIRATEEQDHLLIEGELIFDALEFVVYILANVFDIGYN